MPDFSTLGRRIRYALASAEKSQADLAKYVGIKSATCSQWCSDKVKALKSDNALKVSRFLNVNYDWLVTGRGAPDAEDVRAIVEDEEDPGDAYVQIPEYRIACGAGPGYTPSFEEIEESVPATYRLSYFQSLGIKPSDCKRFVVHGDSMEPTLYSGDRVLVNCADHLSIKNNHVYAINFEDEVRVKRLIRMMNGDLIIKSDNESYEDEIIKRDDETVQFSIIGRVIERAGSGGL